MHIHKITKEKHFEFLQENRQDPITGDLIVEGNEIVFCSECKSAFLKESWEYLSKTHCNSFETLIDFPIHKVLELRVLNDRNALWFPIKNSENENFETFGYKLDNYFWKKVKVSLQINMLTQKSIEVEKNILDFKKYVLYMCMGFVVALCIVLGIAIDFSEQVYILLVGISGGVIILPLIYIEDENIRKLSENDFFLDKRRKLLHFKENGILIYFDKEKSAYSIEYTDIVQIIISAQSVTISTQNGHQITLQLIEIAPEQIQNIIHNVYKFSSSTLIIFKNQPVIIKRLLKNLEKEYSTLWIE